MNIENVKYEQKQNINYGRNIESELINSIKNYVLFGTSETDEQKIREEFDAEILAKLESGKRLTPKEMQYLKNNNPVLYAQAVRVEIKRHSVEEQLKHARSKREVQEIYGEALLTIRKNDLALRYIMAAINETVKEFKETDSYRNLPEVEKTEDDTREYYNKLKNQGDFLEDGEKNFSISYDDGKIPYQLAFVNSIESSYSGYTALS